MVCYFRFCYIYYSFSRSSWYSCNRDSKKIGMTHVPYSKWDMGRENVWNNHLCRWKKKQIEIQLSNFSYISLYAFTLCHRNRLLIDIYIKYFLCDATSHECRLSNNWVYSPLVAQIWHSTWSCPIQFSFLWMRKGWKWIEVMSFGYIGFVWFGYIAKFKCIYLSISSWRKGKKGNSVTFTWGSFLGTQWRWAYIHIYIHTERWIIVRKGTLDGVIWLLLAKIASTDDLRDGATSDLVLLLLDDSIDPFDLCASIACSQIYIYMNKENPSWKGIINQ